MYLAQRKLALLPAFPPTCYQTGQLDAKHLVSKQTPKAFHFSLTVYSSYGKNLGAGRTLEVSLVLPALHIWVPLAG